mmetsp:Transcript_76253/g.247351  ORF Transcript_76253/g.247351 Transcript_76253/m.247351 type:complete len:169 (-) Transcript_76253:429-935(-)
MGRRPSVRAANKTPKHTHDDLQKTGRRAPWQRTAFACGAAKARPSTNTCKCENTHVCLCALRLARDPRAAYNAIPERTDAPVCPLLTDTSLADRPSSFASSNSLSSLASRSRPSKRARTSLYEPRQLRCLAQSAGDWPAEFLQDGSAPSSNKVCTMRTLFCFTAVCRG